ncbi:cation diffusion facilitator family transporter [Riemerella columbina]|uniref:cation diffusion facilitator family transporter n=1 Tax=Riemerella columbina TaxID=103810 RepID=UPI00266E9210|nr:cation diffusion facilitator family transporter [Riemerella columbina]WKS95006.1 cation diffusion facilitator family transporter [Riemerella columbina]
MNNAQNKYSFQRTIAIIGVLLFIGKLVAWQLTNSDAIFSDAMESIVNIIAAFMGLYSLYLASKPKDHDHPYGHGKVEFITAGIEGALIIFAGILIIVQSVSSLLEGNELHQLDWGIGIVAATAVANYIMGYISYQKGKRENSLVLMSSGKHLQSDTLTTLGVVVSLVLVYITKIDWLDAAVALVFGAYIMVVGYKIVRQALSGIMDEKDEALFSEIVQVLQDHRHKEWIDIHNMKVQQFGAHLHIDAHMTLPYYYTLREAHQQMEKAIKLLLSHTERTVEFNFHMDDCKPFSCEICEMDCPFRSKAFVKSVVWTAENAAQVNKHCLNA